MVRVPVFSQVDFPEGIVSSLPARGCEWGAMGGDEEEEEEEEEDCDSNPPWGGQPAEGKGMSHGRGGCGAGWSCVGAEGRTGRHGRASDGTCSCYLSTTCIDRRW